MPSVLPPLNQPAQPHCSHRVHTGVFQAPGQAENHPGRREPLPPRSVHGPLVQQERGRNGEQDHVLDVGHPLDVQQPSVERDRDQHENGSLRSMKPGDEPPRQEQRADRTEHSEHPGVVNCRAEDGKPSRQGVGIPRWLVQERRPVRAVGDVLGKTAAVQDAVGDLPIHDLVVLPARPGQLPEPESRTSRQDYRERGHVGPAGSVRSRPRRSR